MWKRTFWLYLFLIILVLLVVKRNVVNIKILDHFHDSARAIHTAYDEGNIPSRMQYLDTIDYYRKLAELNNNWDFVHSMLGYCYFQTGKVDQSIEEYKKALIQSPEFLGIYYDLALLYFQKKQWNRVVDVATKALDIQDEKSLYYLNVVADKRNVAGDEKNKWLSQHIVRLKIAHEQLHKMLVLAYDHLQENDKLYALSSKLVQINSQPLDWYLFFSGKAAYHLNKNEEAFMLLEAALKNNPNFKEADVLLSTILKAKGRDDLAVVYARRGDDLPAMDSRKFFDPTNQELIMYMPVNEINR